MPLRNKLPRRAAPSGETAMKVVSFQLLPCITVAAHLAAFWLSGKGSLFPGADTLMNIISTCAEIIAGLYGITLAGYTFFLSRIDALTAADNTLDHIVASVKRRFKYLIWFITLNVLATLFTSVFLMYCPVPSNPDHVFYYRLFCNEFVLSLGSSILLILYYSILVIDPNCLEKEAAKLKKQISRDSGPAGSAAEFIALYDRIEAGCSAMLPPAVLDQLQKNKGKQFELTLELLEEQPRLRPLLAELRRIHRYYECMVNCRPLTASQEMCDAARRALAALER